MEQEQYSDSGFWAKLKGYARQAGREVVQKALWLYYAAQRPDTPKWAKTVIFGALGVFHYSLGCHSGSDALGGFQ